jgi:SAM-dependent methyltransferase
MSRLACPHCKNPLESGCITCTRVYTKRSGFLDLRLAGPHSLAAQSNFWPLTAWVYEIWRQRALSLLSGRPFPLSEEFQRMMEFLGSVAGKTYLDLGTSTGLYSRALLAAGAAQVYALDFSPAMLRQAVQRAGGHPGFQPLLANAQAIPLIDQSVDGVVIGGSWNEFGDPAQVAAELRRVLRPGGQLWLMYSQATGGMRRVLQATGLSFPSRDETQQLLRAHGLSTHGWQEGGVVFVCGTIVNRGELG